MREILEIIRKMQTSKVSNYVIAGLDSYLLENGNVRVFKNNRNHQDQITPHSHRFDFTCLVLNGYVINKVWTECTGKDGDLFQLSELIYSGDIGEHRKKPISNKSFSFNMTTYKTGQTYSMKAEEIHSIEFSKGAVVLFFEGPTVREESLIIEPVVNGEVVPTYEKKSYMFKRD